MRALYVKKNPLCEHCEDEGRVVPGEDVDHILPIDQGGARLSFDNLQHLCRMHHNRKTAGER